MFNLPYRPSRMFGSGQARLDLVSLISEPKLVELFKLLSRLSWRYTSSSPTAPKHCRTWLNVDRSSSPNGTCMVLKLRASSKVALASWAMVSWAIYVDLLRLDRQVVQSSSPEDSYPWLMCSWDACSHVDIADFAPRNANSLASWRENI